MFFEARTGRSVERAIYLKLYEFSVLADLPCSEAKAEADLDSDDPSRADIALALADVGVQFPSVHACH